MAGLNNNICKRNCPFCGKEFDSYMGIKIYCNEKCKRELNRERNRELERKRWKKRCLK